MRQRLYILKHWPPPIFFCVLFSNKSQTGLTTGPDQLDLPRVGRINFSNCLPINLPIERGKVAVNARFVDGTPQELNCLFQSGALELSSTSSFLYVTNGNDLTLVPGLSISSVGAVGSVLFFSRCKPSQLDGETVMVPKASATSIRLLTLMLKLEYGIEVNISVVEKPELGADFRSQPDGPHQHGEDELQPPAFSAAIMAALVIGDRALKIDDAWSTGAERVDLGQWWTGRFKLPMVFGVFVARNDFVECSSQSYNQISDSLREAKNLGMTSMQIDVIETASAMTGLSKERMARYFQKELDYELNEAHLESLSLFRRLLMENNML